MNFARRLLSRIAGTTRTDPKPVNRHALGSGPVRYMIEQSWCDLSGFFIEGWMHAGPHRLRRLNVSTGQHHYDISRFAARNDLTPFFPDLPTAAEAGFALYMPWQPGAPIRFDAETDAGSWAAEVLLPCTTPDWSRPFCLTDGSTDLQNPPPEPGADALVDFLTAVQARGRETAGQRVAEIGARAVSQNWTTLRPWFDGTAEYIGIDIHPGHNVDVVGDAHYLHDLVGPGTLDATFSLSVMEHLAYPWLFAHNVNRALRLGGLTFQSTHHTWPLHELPNDFWRFSDEGLKLLFGRALGFEVIRAGFRDRMHIHRQQLRPADARIPLVDAWGGVFIYARKVAEIEEGAIAWPADIVGSTDLARSYPGPAR
jgi:hypothetical protein